MLFSMDTWLGTLIAFGVSLSVYLSLIMKKRCEAPKAGLVAVGTYILLGLALIAIGWNMNPKMIVIPGLFVAFLNVLQLKLSS